METCLWWSGQVSTIPARNFPGTNLTVSCRFLAPSVRCISTILPGETCTGWLGSSAATSTVRSKSAAGGQKDSRGWSRWWCRGKVSCKSDNLRRRRQGGFGWFWWLFFFLGGGWMKYGVFVCFFLEGWSIINAIYIYIYYRYICNCWGREHVEMKLAHLENSLLFAGN